MKFYLFMILPSVWVWVSVCFVCCISACFLLSISVLTLPSWPTHVSAVVPTYWEFRTVYICRCIRFTIFVTFKICILCINEQTFTKRFRGRQFQGEITKRDIWSEYQRKLSLLTARTYWSRGNALVLRSQDVRCSSSNLTATYIFFWFFFFFHLWVVWWVGSCFSHVAWDLNLFVLFLNI